MGNYITVADVREDMMDRMAEDHLVLTDLAFTDADIQWAMQACARKFNSLKPMCGSVTAETLPLNSSVFLDGVAWALVRRWHRNVSFNDYQYSAGGVSANVQGNLLRNLENLRNKLEQEFVQGATDLKITINIDGAFGQIG